ncbi:MAG: nucleotidyltransferase family protein [Bacteroidota bacterium]
MKLRKPEFQQRYHVTKLALFGSYARNEQHPASDIDILVELSPVIEDLFSVKEEIRKELKDKFKKNIDICREKYLKSYYRDVVLKDAVYV